MNNSSLLVDQYGNLRAIGFDIPIIGLYTWRPMKPTWLYDY